MPELKIVAIGLIIISIFAIGGFFWAYGDDIDEKYYDVPFECKEFISEEELIIGNKTTYLLNCKKLIEVITKPDIKVIQECDAECQEVIDKAIECRESDYTLEGCYGTGQVEEPTYTPDPDLTEEQNDLLEDAEEKFNDRCNKDKLDKADRAFCNLYAERSICERGYLESQPIQKHDFFLTSNWKVGIWTMFDYKTEMALGIMSAAVEECTAQKRLQIDLGPYYLDMYLATINDGTPYHADVAGQVFQPIHPLELTPAVHATSVKVAENTLCSERQFQSSWKDYGCTPIFVKKCEVITDEVLAWMEDTTFAKPQDEDWWPNVVQYYYDDYTNGLPIKEFLQQKYEQCLEPPRANPNPSWDPTTSQAWINADNYRSDPIYSLPIGIPKSGVIITDCGDTEGKCQLVFPAN